MEERVVLLLGRSLLLSGVAACLEECTGVRVLRATTWTEAAVLLAGRSPDVAIFDLNSAYANHILPLVLEKPHLLMVGLDAEANRAVLLAGQEAHALTLQRVREIVQGGPTIAPGRAG